MDTFGRRRNGGLLGFACSGAARHLTDPKIVSEHSGLSRPIGPESWIRSKLSSLPSIGCKLHRPSSTVQLSELVYVFLRLQQMKRRLQAHKSCYAANEGGAVGR